jgi:DNA-binding NarL/FixJ family response regulator
MGTRVSIHAVVASARLAVRKALRSVVESNTALVVVGEATTGPELVDLCNRLSPEVILVDSSSSGFEGFAILGRSHQRVILISDQKGSGGTENLELAVTLCSSNIHISELLSALRKLVE